MPHLPPANCRCLELIIVYAGDGKGKTSSCAGQALRALGQGMRVVFGQFIKRPEVAGEQKMLQKLLGDDFRAGGIGFCLPESDIAPHLNAARALLAWAGDKIGDDQKNIMLILDEAIYALDYGLVQKDDLQPFAARAAGSAAWHLVLSGRNPPKWLLNMADIVTDMRCHKHAAQRGQQALPGVEY